MYIYRYIFRISEIDMTGLPGAKPGEPTHDRGWPRWFWDLGDPNTDSLKSFRGVGVFLSCFDGFFGTAH